MLMVKNPIDWKKNSFIKQILTLVINGGSSFNVTLIIVLIQFYLGILVSQHLEVRYL
jgi:hypothetical protein